MWVFLNDAFVSIVAHRDKPGTLLVRARKAGDIQRAMRDYSLPVHHTPGADYAYRAEVHMDDVADAMVQNVALVDYDNFKASVQDADRHDAYLDVWSAAMRLQAAR